MLTVEHRDSTLQDCPNYLLPAAWDKSKESSEEKEKKASEVGETGGQGSKHLVSQNDCCRNKRQARR